MQMKIHLNKRKEVLDIAVEEKKEESDHNQHPENIITSYSLVTLFVPIVALVLVLAYGNLLALNYLHVLTGGTWTGIDLFMGVVMSRILKGLEPQARTQVIKKLVSLMLFAAVVIVVILSVQGFGILMPTEIRIFLELRKKTPNRDKIIKWGMRNVKLAGSQGVFQVALIFVMANLALGFTLIPQ